MRVCLLARAQFASLEPVGPLTIIDALSTNVAPGFDRFPERHARVVRELAAPGGWRLNLSSNPQDALPLIRAMLDA